MKEKMLAKFSNAFLFLAVGFLMLFSPFATKAQNTSARCEKGYVWDQVYDQVYEQEQEPWYNTANGAWQTRTVGKYKWRYVWKCVPIPPKDGSTTSRDEKNNSAGSTTATDAPSNGTATPKPTKTLSRQIIEKYKPIQLNSHIIAGVLNTENSRRASFYTFWAVPGQLTITLTVEASAHSGGNTILVTLFDPNEKAVSGDGEAPLGSRLTTTNYGRITRDVFEIDISERLPILLRIEPYNTGSGKYQIQLAGAIDLGKPDSITKEPSPGLRPPYAGQYSGSWITTYSDVTPQEGEWTLSVDTDGKITGKEVNTTFDATAEISGFVTKDGQIELSLKYGGAFKDAPIARIKGSITNAEDRHLKGTLNQYDGDKITSTFEINLAPIRSLLPK